MVLGPAQTGPEIKTILYFVSRFYGSTCNLWQKASGKTHDHPLGFWSWAYRGSEANYIPTEQETLAAYEGVRAVSEVIGQAFVQ